MARGRKKQIKPKTEVSIEAIKRLADLRHVYGLLLENVNQHGVYLTHPNGMIYKNPSVMLLMQCNTQISRLQLILDKVELPEEEEWGGLLDH